MDAALQPGAADAAGAASGVRVLGVDAALRSTGLGAVEARGNRMRAVEHGVVRCPDAWPHSRCLRRLFEEVGAAIARVRPAAAAIEGGFYAKNARTALILGQARGVVIAACAVAGVPVWEYPPRQVKQALAGSGSATKEQVARMVARLLGLAESPPEDAADALAVALCHLHRRTSAAALAPREL